MRLGELVVNIDTGDVGIVVLRQPRSGIGVLWNSTGLINEMPWELTKRIIRLVLS